MGRRWVVGAVVALGTLLGVGGLAYRNTLQLVTTQWWIAHTHDVLDNVDATVAILKDAEIAVRGYVVTGDEMLARRRELARPALNTHLRHLSELVADNPQQEDNLAALDAAIRAKLAYTDDVIEQRRTRDLPPAELDARLAEGLRRIDEIRGLAVQVQDEERQLLAVREDAAHTGTRRTLVVIATGTLLGVGILVVVLALLNVEIGQRRRVEDQLRRTERRLTLALDAAQMGLWDLDIATDESHRTLRHDQIFGFDTLQPVWGRDEFRRRIHPADRGAEEHAFADTLTTGEFHIECRIVRYGDGAIRWISGHGKLFRDAAGEPTHLMGSVQDVTERKEAEEHLRERTQQLEAANEALGSFTYSVSHDLRAPLRAINGYAHILAEDHADMLDGESRRVLDVICTNAQQMGRLIDDLLAFSRMGRADLERTATDLTALTHAVVTDLRRLEPARAIRIDVAALPDAVADGSMMRHVLANLIGNAWKFTRGCTAAAIEVGSTSTEHETIYWVKDNGAGFDMQYAGKLFRVFERLHRADEFEGTGVGLAIVQRVVQRHGGRVWAESVLGAGATFHFSLPNGKGEQHGADERRDSLGRGQPSGCRAGSASAQEA